MIIIKAYVFKKKRKFESVIEVLTKYNDEDIGYAYCYSKTIDFPFEMKNKQIIPEDTLVWDCNYIQSHIVKKHTDESFDQLLEESKQYWNYVPYKENDWNNAIDDLIDWLSPFNKPIEIITKEYNENEEIDIVKKINELLKK
jgi:hypothetical protein